MHYHLGSCVENGQKQWAIYEKGSNGRNLVFTHPEPFVVQQKLEELEVPMPEFADDILKELELED